MTTVVDAPERAQRPLSRRAGVAGAVAAGMSLGVSELLGAVRTGDPSLVTSIGEATIDLAPGGVVDAGISVFGTNDKPALVIGILLVCLWLGYLVGRRGSTGFGVPTLAFGLAGVAGWLATVRDPLASGSAGLVIAVLSVLAGLATFAWLRQIPEKQAITSETPIEMPGGRRQFLGRAGMAAGVAVVAPAVGRRLRSAADVEADRANVQLATSADTAGTELASGLDVDGLSPLYTPNADFYRIDTALVIPKVETSSWSLKITGEVENEIEIGFDELVAMSVEQADVTIACVSNEVGGGLVGNARWTGVTLSDVLDRAGRTAAAEQVMGVSVDGFTAGFPIELAYDGRPAMIAVGMNGEPLPVRHGFPARLIVSGIYGYVSATKWLSEIRLTRWDGVDGYWIPRGWSKTGPIKLQSRIDVPRSRARVAAGRVPIAGVAWAQPVGVAAVEVQIDDGPWTAADLGTELAGDTWRQWVLPWDAEPGEHRITVRAIDAAGQIQTSDRAAVAPDGATGHHSVVVQVV